MMNVNVVTHRIDLTEEDQVALINYALERLVKDEVERRKTPALFQPKVDRFRDERDPPYHPTYTPT